MGYAMREYQWNYIAPNATVGVFLHPYSVKEVVSFSLTVSNGNRPGFVPAAEITSAGTVQEHVDGLGRTIWIANRSKSNGGPPTPVVVLNSMIELLP